MIKVNEKLYVLFFSYGKGKNLIFVAAEETAWYTIAKIAFCSSPVAFEGSLDTSGNTILFDVVTKETVSLPSGNEEKSSIAKFFNQSK